MLVIFKKIIVTGILVFSFLCFAPANASSVVIGQDFSSLGIGPQVDFFLSNEITTLEQLLKLEKNQKVNWSRLAQKTPGFGYQEKRVWGKFTLEFSANAPVEELLLEHTYSPMDNLEFYSPTKFYDPVAKSWQMKYSVQYGGDMVAVEKRSMFHQNNVFYLNRTNAQGKITYYFKVESTSSLIFPLTIYTKYQFYKKMSIEMLSYGIFYGIMLIMVFYNLFLFFSIRDIGYLYYVLYIFAFIIFQATLNGFSILFFWPGMMEWNNMALPSLVVIATGTAVMFTREFLNLKTYARGLDRIMKYLMYFYFSFAVISLFLSYANAIKIAIVTVIPTAGFFIVAALVSLKRGFAPARYFLTSWLFFLVGTILILLKSISILPSNFFTDNAQQIGAAIEVLLLSLGLADKINQYKKEKERAKEEMIESITSTNIAYSRFVPMEFLNFLNKKSIQEVNLGDQIQKEMTVMFIDIRSFTALSEGMTPEENFNFLNSYLKRINPIIKNYHGFIDKFIGDAVMALFPADSRDALNSAVAIRQELQRYNEHRKNKKYPAIEIGIGLHKGQLILGTIGNADRMEGTVISDAVNLASRLEGLTKRMGCSIIFSEQIKQEISAEDFHYRFLGKVKVKGKQNAIEIFELFSFEEETQIVLKTKTQASFEKGIHLIFKKNFNAAMEEFREVVHQNPQDFVAKLMLDRLETSLKNSLI